jgi:hypothetical protein
LDSSPVRREQNDSAGQTAGSDIPLHTRKRLRQSPLPSKMDAGRIRLSPLRLFGKAELRLTPGNHNDASDSVKNPTGG